MDNAQYPTCTFGTMERSLAPVLVQGLVPVSGSVWWTFATTDAKPLLSPLKREQHISMYINKHSPTLISCSLTVYLLESTKPCDGQEKNRLVRGIMQRWTDYFKRTYVCIWQKRGIDGITSSFVAARAKLFS